MDVGCYGGWSLHNYDNNITTSLRLSHAPFFQKKHPQLHCKGEPIRSSTAYQDAKTICIIWMWDTINGGWQPQPWHHNIIHAPPYSFYSKIHTHLHMYYDIRVHLYAHPQHIKVLNTLHTNDMDVGSSQRGLVASTMKPQHPSYRLCHTIFIPKFTPDCTCTFMA